MIAPADKFENWLLGKNLKERTIKEYMYYFFKFQAQVFDQESVSRFLSEKSNRNPVAKGFLVNFKKFLLVNYRELAISEELKSNIALVELPQMSGRKKSRLVRPIAHEDIFLLEKYLPTEKERLQLMISYFCGLRMGELFKIRILDFNWDKWKKDQEEPGECNVLGKGDKEGVAYVPAQLMRRIATFIHSQNFSGVDAYIFRTKGRTYKDSKGVGRGWEQKLQEAALRAGLSKVDSEGKVIKETAVHPHRLRHSWGYHLVNVLNVDIRKVKELLRHSSITSTQIYTLVSDESLKKTISSVSVDDPSVSSYEYT